MPEETKLEPGKKSSEFYVTLLTTVLGFLKATVLPDLPEETFYTAIAYIGGRTARKMTKK